MPSLSSNSVRSTLPETSGSPTNTPPPGQEPHGLSRKTTSSSANQDGVPRPPSQQQQIETPITEQKKLKPSLLEQQLKIPPILEQQKQAMVPTLKQQMKVSGKENYPESRSKSSIGDVMLHKMKGFPYWPVKITSIEAGR